MRKVAAPRLRDRLAVLLRRHHGHRAARRHQPPAPRHALFGLAHDHLRDAVRHRLARRLRPALGRDRRGDGALGPDRDLGHQPGEHPGQRHDPRRAGEKGARRQAGGGRPVSHRHRRAGGRASGAASRDRRRARLRGDARAVPRRPCRSRLPGEIRRRLARARGASRDPHAANGRRGSPGCRSPRSRPSPASTARPGARTCASASASPGAGTAPPTCMPRPACPW